MSDLLVLWILANDDSGFYKVFEYYIVFLTFFMIFATHRAGQYLGLVDFFRNLLEEVIDLVDISYSKLMQNLS